VEASKRLAGPGRPHDEDVGFAQLHLIVQMAEAGVPGLVLEPLVTVVNGHGEDFLAEIPPDDIGVKDFLDFLRFGNRPMHVVQGPLATPVGDHLIGQADTRLADGALDAGNERRAGTMGRSAKGATSQWGV
jgi:hypothetical protein